MSKELGRFQREIVEVCEFFVDDENQAGSNVIYKKNLDGKIIFSNPTKYLKDYLGSQGVTLKDDIFGEVTEEKQEEIKVIEEIDTL